MSSRPGFYLYSNDLYTDVAMCSAATVGIWTLILCLMNKQGRGTIADSFRQIQKATRCTKRELEKALQELHDYGIAEVSRPEECDIISIKSARMTAHLEDLKRKRSNEKATRKRLADASEADTVTDAADNLSSSSHAHARPQESWTRATGEKEDYGGKESVVVPGEARPQLAMESWNEFAAALGLPSVRKLTPDRETHVRQQWDELWPMRDALYDEIRGSPFLCGENDRGWQISFDFVWGRPDRGIQILEGKYRGKPVINNRDVAADHEHRRQLARRALGLE